MRFRFILFFLAGLLLASACSNFKVDPTVPYEGSYRSYKKILKQWTRSENVYEPSFDTIMTVTATWESNLFRQAFLKEKARTERLLPGEVKSLEKKYDEEQDRIVSFLLSFYTPKFKWNKLHQENASWRIWLIDAAGAQVAPLSVDRTEKVSLAMTRYYPYYDQWSSLYQVKFPGRDNDGKPLKLTGGTVKFLISGVFGSAELVWEVPD